MGALPYVSTTQAMALLRAGIAVAGESFGPRFGPLAKTVHDELATRWEFESEPLAVRRLINEQLLELKAEVLERLRKRQEELLDVVTQPTRYAGAEVLEEEMSLLDATVVSASAVAQRAGNRLRGQLDDAVRSTQIVVRYLAGRETLDAAADPFGPEVFCFALLTAAEDLGLRNESWDYLIRSFEAGLAQTLAGVLQDVLDHFLKNGLDPRVIRRDLSARRAAQRGVDAAGADVPTLPGLPGGPWTTVPGAPQAAAPVRYDAPQADPRAVLGSLLARLNANARDLPLPALPRNTPPGAALLDAVSELQSLGLQGLHGATLSTEQSGRVTEWRSHLVGTAGRTVDKLTIELVGMLFDRVLQDQQVPAEIKALLSRLQFPVLKAALLDADFFAAGSHPARRLIDRIAATALGWEPYGEDNERYRVEVERVVKDVLAQFEKNVAVFDRTLAEFERFLAELSPREGDPVNRAKQALEDAERREVLAINLSIQVRCAFDKVELEPYLRDFLLGPWVQVLVAATLRDEQTPGFSKRFREAIHDLVWSVQPKANTDDRKRLTALIPELIRVLRDSWAFIRAAERDAQDFFRHLMESHAVAVKPVDQATYIKSALVASEVKARVDDLQVDLSRPLSTLDGALRVSTDRVLEAAMRHRAQFSLPAEPPPMVPDDMDRVEVARLAAHLAAWARGDWFELTQGEYRLRLRLRWISPLRTLFLFSANQEQDALALTSDSVRAYAQDGRLRPLQAVPLTKRAVEHVLNDLERQPQKVAELTARHQAGE